MSSPRGEHLPQQKELEDALLTHFAKAYPLPLREEKMQIGGMEYFNFSCFGKDEFGVVGAYGRSPNRRAAAVKCVAEVFERRIMQEFAGSEEASVPALTVDLTHGLERETVAPVPPRRLRTSNGWAVHFDLEQAKQRAVSEAFERHLLLKSFLSFSWEGFQLRDSFTHPEVNLSLFTSSYSHLGCLSGLAACQSPLYLGVSFGYCYLPQHEIGNMAAWENAILESVDKIAMLKGKSIRLEDEPNSWILSEIKTFLESPFDTSALGGATREVQEDSAKSVFIKTFDLQKHLHLDFPLFAAFAWGEELIPLFHKPRLDELSLRYLTAACRRHGLEKIPESHPIL